MLRLLKGKLVLIGGGIIAFLLAALKILSLQNKRNKRRAEQAEKTLKFKADVDILDAEIEQEFSHRAEEAQKDMEEGRVPDNLSKPNTKW